MHLTLPLALLALSAPPEMLHVSHPLAGRVWDVHRQCFVSLSALKDAARQANFVLLGETHDNPRHHLLQAEVLQSLIASGRRPALAFEMLDISQQGAVDRAVKDMPGDPQALAEAVGWPNSGWPEFSLYEPIFTAGLGAKLPVVAANLPPQQVKATVYEGASALDGAVRKRIERQGPLPEKARLELREEMRSSHCGELPDEWLDPMILAQRARDAEMAQRLEAADQGQGAVLIAGSGHVRDDRGVPALLEKDNPHKRVLSISFIEVSPEATRPADYAAQWGGALPFDYVVFTPAAQRADPCAQLRQARTGPHKEIRPEKKTPAPRTK
jgi:uncharacterized iron-regulated protein